MHMPHTPQRQARRQTHSTHPTDRHHPTPSPLRGRLGTAPRTGQGIVGIGARLYRPLSLRPVRRVAARAGETARETAAGARGGRGGRGNDGSGSGGAGVRDATTLRGTLVGGAGILVVGPRACIASCDQRDRIRFADHQGVRDAGSVTESERQRLWKTESERNIVLRSHAQVGARRTRMRTHAARKSMGAPGGCATDAPTAVCTQQAAQSFDTPQALPTDQPAAVPLGPHPQQPPPA